jgi:hypothetical protein
MTVHVTRTVFVLAIATATACNTQRAGTDAPPAEEQGSAAATAASAPATAASAAETPRASAKQAPAVTPAQAAKEAEAQRLIAGQKALNEEQAQTNARLQQEVERLKPREITIPTGTVIPVRTVSELSTSTLSDGATFDAVLEHDLAVGGVVVARAGTRATGVVVTADKGGRVKGTASLTVGLRALMGTKSNVIAVKTDSYSSEAASTKKKDAVRTGVATGVGAVVGGIAGGGKGAAIGAGVGAAAGVGTNAATRGAAAVIPAEQLMEFHLAAPVTIVIQP